MKTVALVKDQVIFGFAETDDDGNFTQNQTIPAQLTVSDFPVDVDPRPGLGWIEDEDGFHSPEVTWETAQEMVSKDSNLNIVDILKGVATAGSDWYKKTVCDVIDKKTKEIIGRGCAFDSNIFSLSLEAQKNWLTFFTLFALQRLPYAITIPTLDNRAYVLQTNKMTDFFNAILLSAQTTIGGGLALKEAVMTSESIPWLQAFIDPRE